MSVLTPYIKKLLADPPTLTPDDLVAVLNAIFRQEASTVQTASFLTALRLRGLDHQPAYIAAAAATLVSYAHTIAPESVHSEGYVDIVGTGGDGQNTFNVSTSSAIVAAGIGLRVCKHGGKASTSTSGSGDLLACLGVDLAAVTAATTPAIVAKSNFCFLFAPSFHPVMASVAPVRTQLGIPTIFNILGPLINPIPLRARVLGVYSEPLGDAYAAAASTIAMSNNSTTTSLVVFGEVGLDEISPSGYTKCWLVDPKGTITKSRICPADFGLPEHPLDSVRSGTPQENAALLLHVLRQDSPEFVVGNSNHPVVDYILMNTAAVAVASGAATSWKEGVELAKQSIVSGAAAASLNDFKLAIDEVKSI